MKTRHIALVIMVYALAKIAELLDREIFELFAGAISGHSIKHLIAALGPVVVIAMMRTWPADVMAMREPVTLGKGAVSHAE